MASAGRRPGSFGDPVSRMRTWTILGLPQGAGVPTLKERSVHWEVPVRTLRSLQRDGADPGLITLFRSISLMDHLAQGGTKWNDVVETYRHPFWRHLSAWSVPQARHWPAPFRSAERWLDYQMQRHGVLRLEPDDEYFAIALGLRERRPTPCEELAPLQVRRFVSLDGLLTLLMLRRQARDALEFDTADLLGSALWQAAHQWEQKCDYDGEALDTWRWLLHTRLHEWLPDARPHAKALAEAERQLQRAQLAQNGTLVPMGKRKTRRWRRRVSMRAGCMQVERSGVAERPCVLFDPAWEWIAEHRAEIDAHCTWANDALIGDVPLSVPSPVPLTMPTSLMQRRQRPLARYEEWMMFGDVLPYDIIPVQADPES